ncbi:hypothetical protein Tco_0580183 [Tanacetum coccineum]
MRLGLSFLKMMKMVEMILLKQGKKLSDAEVQEKASTETKPIIQEVTPTKVIQDQGSIEKGNSKVSTVGATKGTASKVPVISIAGATKMVWDFNQHIEPMDLEHGSERMKSPEKIEKEDVDTQKEMKEFNREDVAEDVVSLSTKYPIVDWKTYVLTENFMYYQIFRGDSSSKNYKVLSGMLEYFDRQDVMDLHRLVKERYSALRPEGYDLMLWGDLHTLFEPDEEDEIWKNQHEYNLIMKKYPLSHRKLSKMLSLEIGGYPEELQAYKLLKFIRSQVQNQYKLSTCKSLVNTARRKVNTVCMVNAVWNWEIKDAMR